MTSHNGQPLIQARGLVKRFGELVAVDGIDFDLQRGEAFGFLGPERRGEDLDDAHDRVRLARHGRHAAASSGSIQPATAPKIRARLGVVPQQDTLDMELTVRENIIIYGRYFGLPRQELGARADELLEFVELTERANDKVEPLSGGMKRRLTIARSLVNDPEVMLLDEPTTGLDPQARHVVWDRLYRLKRQGVTLLLTTHYMDEAEQLCDRLVVMDKGKIVAEGSPRELIERYSTREVVELRFDDDSDPTTSATGRTGSSAASSRSRTACSCTPTTATRRRTAARARARPRERPRSSKHARGRLSPPHRAEPRSNDDSSRSTIRPLEFFLAQYNESGVRSVVTSVVTPIVYLLALGVGLGAFVDDVTFRGQTYAYLEFVAPGLWPPRRCRSRRSRRAGPCSRRSSGTVSTTRCWRRRCAYRGTSCSAHQAFIASRMLLTATVYLVVIAAFGAVESPLGVLRDPGRRPRRARRSRRRSPPGRRTRRTRCRSSRSSGS